MELGLWVRRRPGWKSALVALAAAAISATSASAATVDTSAWYVLVNRNSGKAVDVYNFATNDGARIAQWTRGDGNNQQWQFVDSGGGYYRLRSRHSGKVLDDYQWSTADNAQIVQWTDLNGTNQQFRLVDSDSGYVRLINRHSNKALSVQGASTANGTNIVQLTDSNGAHQQWQLVQFGGTDPAQSARCRPPSAGARAACWPARSPTPRIPTSRPSRTTPWCGTTAPGRCTRPRRVLRRAGTWCTSRSRTGRRRTAPRTPISTRTPIGRGYRAAPHLFFFAPQGLWYMVYQTGVPTYSTSTDPGNPRSWTTPRNFISSEPAIVTQNKGAGSWLDFWMICDSSNCYLFSSDDNGHIYRSQTTLANFPNGFGNTVIALQDSRFALFEGSAVYKVQSANQYLLLQEAIGSDGRRWYRSYTSNSLTGSWTPHLATESNPFARSNTVTFSGTAWTRDFSHGELIRAGNDQTVPLNPCRLQFLYQGQDPNASGDYIRLPWRMGLLTQTNSTC